MNRLGDLLEAERAKRDLTLTDFAEQVLGISHSLVSRYVNGVQSPNRRTARKIATALGVTVTDIDAMLAEEDVRRRGYDKPGLGPTGHLDDLDIPGELRALRADLAPFLGRLDALLARIDDDEPSP